MKPDTIPCPPPERVNTLDEYQRRAERTVGNNTLTTATLGLCGEAGEFADMLKKYKAQGHPFSREKAIKELGDILWYVAIAARLLDADLSAVAQQNVEKLRARYPEGFEAERSVNRKDGDV